LFLGLGLLPLAARAGEVQAALRPDGGWKMYATRTVAQSPELAALSPDSNLDQFGGWIGRPLPATGYFYATNLDGRWWLIDPAGGLFLHKGIAAVTPLHSPGAEPSFQSKFGTEPVWAAQTAALLRENGFNGAGAWSSPTAFHAAPETLVYTRLWNFMSAYGKKRGGTFQQPGHTGYPGDCIFVFDPEFAVFCEQYAKQLAAEKDDPWLLGHFSDNELPFRRGALTNYLALPEADPGRQAALSWLRARHGKEAGRRDVTDEDARDFLAVVVDRYFRIVSQAIHKYDPHHLFLGSRFHGADVNCPEVFRAAAPYLDVVSVNYYYAWTPKPADLEMWARESGRPVLITEWYAKGVDSGLSNRSGAGWVVKTQRDRGLFYQNFTLGLLASKACVGWHWLQYVDNDPNDPKADPSNRDANKGIVNIHYEPYTPLLDAMRQVNERAYAIALHDQGGAP
jgi:hypothetical protein